MKDSGSVEAGAQEIDRRVDHESGRSDHARGQCASDAPSGRFEQ